MYGLYAAIYSPPIISSKRKERKGRKEAQSLSEYLCDLGESAQSYTPSLRTFANFAIFAVPNLMCE